MSEDVYAKPDLTKKVRFQTGDKENKDAEICDNVDDVVIYDNCWAEGSTPPKSQENTTDDQEQITSVNVSSGKRNLHKAPAVFLGLLFLVLLAAVIVLVVLLIQDKNKWNQLWMDNAKLTNESEKLQTNYSEIERINHNLTQKISILEDEKCSLKASNNNLTNERDELRKQIEMTRCPAKWMKFGKSCYLFSISKKNWYDSRKFCENQDAQLVIISSIEEQKFVSSFLRPVWIGLTDERKEGEWMWVDGTAVTTTYWRERQPDNHEVNGETENCATISSPNPLKNWNDLPCSRSAYVMCEKIMVMVHTFTDSTSV